MTIFCPRCASDKHIESHGEDFDNSNDLNVGTVALFCHCDVCDTEFVLYCEFEIKEVQIIDEVVAADLEDTIGDYECEGELGEIDELDEVDELGELDEVDDGDSEGGSKSVVFDNF